MKINWASLICMGVVSMVSGILLGNPLLSLISGVFIGIVWNIFWPVFKLEL